MARKRQRDSRSGSKETPREQLAHLLDSEVFRKEALEAAEAKADAIFNEVFMKKLLEAAEANADVMFKKAAVEILANRDRIVALERQVAAQQDEICALRSGQFGVGGTDAETKERQRSLVLLNLDEGACQSEYEANHYTANEVSKILRFLDVPYAAISTYRLGRKTLTHPRLVKIVLPSTAAKIEVLRRAKKLKFYETSGRPQLFLRPSMTQEERKRDYEERMRRKNCASAATPQLVPTPSMSSLSPQNPLNSHTSTGPPLPSQNLANTSPISTHNRFVPYPRPSNSSVTRSNISPHSPQHTIQPKNL